MNKLLNLLTQFIKEEKAYAHCDIPCGIYDPFVVQRAAHTLLRMTNLIVGVKRENEIKAEHDIARMTIVKEKHADLLEEELETLRNDYFKKDHYKDFSNLNDLFITTLEFLAKTRQGIDVQAASDTLEGVLKISEIFFKTKGVIPVRIKSIYPTEGEIVIYK